MIYTVGRVSIVAKQCYGKDVIQAQYNTVKGLMSQDPAISGMDLLIIDAGEISKGKLKEFTSLAENKHPNLAILCTIKNDKENHGIEGVTYAKVPKITVNALREAVDPVLKVIAELSNSAPRIKRETIGKSVRDGDDDDEDEELITPPVEVSRKDLAKSKFSRGVKAKKEEVEEEVRPLEEDYDLRNEEAEEEEIELDIDLSKVNYGDKFNETYETGKKLPEEIPAPLSNRIKDLETPSIDSFIRDNQFDFSTLQSLLDRDSLSKQLLKECSAYEGAMAMMETLELQMRAISKDTTTPHTVKFKKIKELCLSKANHADIKNSFISERLVEIINNVINAVEKFSNERIDELTNMLQTYESADKYFKSEEMINKQLMERLQQRDVLVSLLNDIVNTYAIIDEESSKFLKNLNEGLPTENAYLNEMMKSLDAVFIPLHTAEVANKVIKDLTTGKEKFAVLENKITALLKAVLDYSRRSDEIVSQQQKITMLLAANKIENTIIIDTPLKGYLRAFIGMDDIGKTATVVTHSGINARIRNTLIINLSPTVDVTKYGIDVINAEDFFTTKLTGQLTAINVQIGTDCENMTDLFEKLLHKLHLYNHVNIIFDAEQFDLLNEHAKDFLSVTFVTNTTDKSVKKINELYSKLTEENVAKKVVIIDPIDDIAPVIEALGIDPFITKMILIPHISKMRYCALKRSKPWEDDNIYRVFSEAFGG